MNSTTDQHERKLKLFQLLLGSKAPARNVEQHDYFFGIGYELKDLVPHIKKFWPEAGASIHIDGWREVNFVDQYQISVSEREANETDSEHKLFFINLGGYQHQKLEEQHYTILTVQTDRATAVQHSKKTVFFKANSIKGANSHIDEKYGIDVDDIYRIEDILSPEFKQRYVLNISPSVATNEDQIHLGYFKLDKI